MTAVLAAALAFGLAKVQTNLPGDGPHQRRTGPAGLGVGNSAKDLLRNFVNNLSTHDMANRVIADAKLDMNSYDLLAKVTVSAEPEISSSASTPRTRTRRLPRRSPPRWPTSSWMNVWPTTTPGQNNRIEVKLWTA